MKKGIVLSVVTLACINLFAQGLNDSVAKKEQQAINNPKVLNQAQKAEKKIEQVQKDMIIKGIYDAKEFKQEALKDRNSMIRASVTKEANYEQKHFKIASKDISEAFNRTINALNALSKGDLKSASKELDKASELFDKALKKDPKLNLVPIANTISIKVFEGSSKVIKEALKKAKKDIEDYNTQEARAILVPMQDEMDIVTIYIPMKIYPKATKAAAKALKENNPQQAVAILMEGLNAKVVDLVVVPIPLLIAQDLVILASKMDKNKKDDILAILDAAKEELLKAYLLGYTKKHDKAYKDLNDQIDAIKKEIKGENKVEKLYKKIKGAFVSLIQKTREDIKHDIAEYEVNKYQKEQIKKAIKEQKLFEQEAKEDLKKGAK